MVKKHNPTATHIRVYRVSSDPTNPFRPINVDPAYIFKASWWRKMWYWITRRAKEW